MRRSPRRVARHRSIVAFLVLLIVAAGVSGRAFAQGDPVEPFDSATGYDHVNPPPPGAASSVEWCFVFSDASLIGQTIEVTADGPTGVVVGVGLVGQDSSARVRVGITDGGTYTITSAVAIESGRSMDTASVGAVDVVFDPAFVDCSEGLALAPPPSTTAAPRTTTSDAATTTAGPTTTGAAISPPSQPAQSPGGSTGWWLLFGGGLALLIVGLALALFPKVSIGAKDRCERERKEVERKTRTLKDKKAALKEIDDELADLAKEIKRLERVKGTASYNKQQSLIRQERRIYNGRRGVASNAVIEAAELLAKAERALAACEKRPPAGPPKPPPPKPGTTSPPHDSSKHEDDPVCCQSGQWIGVNLYVGGIAGVVGGETGSIYMFCVDDLSKRGVYTWSGIRLGLGGGGELSGAVVFLQGDWVHPREVIIPLRAVLTGIDFDVSIGLGWTKLLKAAFRGVRAGVRLGSVAESLAETRKLVKLMKAAEKAGSADEAAQLAAGSAGALEELAHTAGSTALNSGSKTASSSAQAGGQGVQIPVGAGLQVGLWKMMNVHVECVSWSGCAACDPEGALKGR